jgi:uncharacterized protein YprB with RNaseH-like and TPR domain
VHSRTTENEPSAFA